MPDTQVPDKQIWPDIYTDVYTLNLNQFGATFTFGVTRPGRLIRSEGVAPSLPPHECLVLRMSLEHAKLMAVLLRDALKQLETEQLKAEIPVPQLRQPLPATAPPGTGSA